MVAVMDKKKTHTHTHTHTHALMHGTQGYPCAVAATAVGTVTFGGDPAGVSSRYVKNAAG